MYTIHMERRLPSNDVFPNTNGKRNHYKFAWQELESSVLQGSRDMGITQGCCQIVGECVDIDHSR